MKTLADIKAGDKVVFRATWGDDDLLFVDRVTKTQIITRLGRFRRSDGFKVGVSGESFRTFITVATEEDTKRITLDKWRKNAIRKLDSAKWADLTDKQLTHMLFHLEHLSEISS